MDWYWVLLVLIGSFVVVIMSGLPVAFSFFFISLIGAYFFLGGVAGLRQLTLNIYSSLATFVLMPLPLFILMGEVMFRSGLAPKMIDTLDSWMGRVPGRLGLLAVVAGVLFSMLTGATMGSVAMLGSTLVPEMERRGYGKPMSLGPILGSGGLAIMIPPSAMAVFIGALAGVSIGKLLIAIVLPGLLMALLYALYIILRCKIQPTVAPSYEVAAAPLSTKLINTAKYILPIGVIVFLVIGVILLGIATPSEAAATGTLGMFLLAAAYRRLSWDMVKKAVIETVKITGMIYLITASATTYGQILAASGATRGLIEFATGLPMHPLLIVVGMIVVLLFLGMFMSPAAMVLITIPLFVPIVGLLGFNKVWFAVVVLLCTEIATTSPPFGSSLFVMKGVAPPGTTMGAIIGAALPFIYCDLVALALIVVFPAVALWLPGMTTR
ncbi:MAG: TRAP transporter large permease subunit [Spirochaetales bacterium]|nr:TRAP transporter large permease subunit [Spirochaetales bacterium]